MPANRAGRRLFPVEAWHVASLGGLTVLLFGGGGILLMQFLQSRGAMEVVLGDAPVLSQLLLGTALGLLIGIAAWRIVTMPFMRASLQRYSRLIGPLLARRRDRLFISICAGVGEEFFFRGALQFWLGIPFTAVLFVAIHGYLDPRNWRITIYGVFMTLAMMGLGWMAEAFGLLAPMIAHAVIDVVLLEGLHGAWLRQRATEDPDQWERSERTDPASPARWP